MKLRLLITEDCHRNCKDCCNKDWDLKNLPVEHDFSKYETIMLTGGEPMLYPYLIKRIIKEIRKVNDCPIILYTAYVHDVSAIIHIIDSIDGMTVTLHRNSDVYDFKSLDSLFRYCKIKKKSLRLNVFKDVLINPNDFPMWNIKTNVEWIKNCPLPKDEVFKRFEKY